MRRKITRDEKKEIWKICEGRCAYCGSTLDPFNYQIDHYHPLSRGGSEKIENLLLSCAPCNLSKSNLEIWEWKEKLESRAQKNVLFYFERYAIPENQDYVFYVRI